MRAGRLAATALQPGKGAADARSAFYSERRLGPWGRGQDFARRWLVASPQARHRDRAGRFAGVGGNRSCIWRFRGTWRAWLRPSRARRTAGPAQAPLPVPPLPCVVFPFPIEVTVCLHVHPLFCFTLFPLKIHF